MSKGMVFICTPDFFGFNGKGELQYRGRIDGCGMDDASNRITSMGCSIKWRS